MTKSLTILIAGLLIGFLIGEFRPRPKTETPDTTQYAMKFDSMARQNSIIADSLRITQFVFANRQREYQQEIKYVRQRLNEKNETRFIPSISSHELDSSLSNLYVTYPVSR